MVKRLLVSSVMLLCACHTKTSRESLAQRPSGNLDPSLYTIEAILLENSDIGRTSPPPYSGSWVGGGGTFENTLDSGVRYRMSLTPSNRNKDQQFTLTYSGKTVTSPVLNFSDCDFTADLGYESTSFHKMKVYFIFNSVQNTLRRVGLSSPEADLTAAICEKVEANSDAKVVYVSSSSDLKIQSQGKLVLPHVASKDQSGIRQTFNFYPTLTNKQEISVISKAGTFPYQVSLKYCVDYFTKIGADVNTLGSEYVELSVESSLTDQGYSCCSVDGACSPVTN